MHDHPVTVQVLTARVVVVSVLAARVVVRLGISDDDAVDVHVVWVRVLCVLRGGDDAAGARHELARVRLVEDAWVERARRRVVAAHEDVEERRQTKEDGLVRVLEEEVLHALDGVHHVGDRAQAGELELHVAGGEHVQPAPWRRQAPRASRPRGRREAQELRRGTLRGVQLRPRDAEDVQVASAVVVLAVTVVVAVVDAVVVAVVHVVAVIVAVVHVVAVVVAVVDAVVVAVVHVVAVVVAVVHVVAVVVVACRWRRSGHVGRVCVQADVHLDRDERSAVRVDEEGLTVASELVGHVRREYQNRGAARRREVRREVLRLRKHETETRPRRRRHGKPLAIPYQDIVAGTRRHDAVGGSIQRGERERRVHDEDDHVGVRVGAVHGTRQPT
ncbi:MAG: hypothetical protein CL862_13185 [Cyanobium sp. NAT70]|nr:hypothetical protein [Cyanobium sp. NAT70]